jgi:hypothetical protein
MEKYYYLACALPKISLKSKPDISFEELKFMLKVNLNKHDLNKINLFRNFIDINNLKLLWLNQEIDPRGNLNVAELEDMILIKEFLPDFVFEYMDRYEKKEDRLRNFSYLITSFFKEVISEDKGFINFYFKFEREMRLIISALRAKKLKRDIAYELQFENFDDEFVAYILAQKDMENFEPPKDYESVRNIYRNNINDPKKLHQDLLEYKFNKIEEYSEKNPFTIDQILSYAALLLIVEDFNKLSIEEGNKKIEKL